MARLCIDVWVTVDGSVKRFDVAITSTDTRASDGVAIATGAQAPFSVVGKGLTLIQETLVHRGYRFTECPG